MRYISQVPSNWLEKSYGTDWHLCQVVCSLLIRMRAAFISLYRCYRIAWRSQPARIKNVKVLRLWVIKVEARNNGDMETWRNFRWFYRHNWSCQLATSDLKLRCQKSWWTSTSRITWRLLQPQKMAVLAFHALRIFSINTISIPTSSRPSNCLICASRSWSKVILSTAWIIYIKQNRRDFRLNTQSIHRNMQMFGCAIRPIGCTRGTSWDAYHRDQGLIFKGNCLLDQTNDLNLLHYNG